MQLFPDATPKRGEVALRPPSELATIPLPENFGEDILGRGLALSEDIGSQSLSAEGDAFNEAAGRWTTAW